MRLSILTAGAAVAVLVSGQAWAGSVDLTVAFAESDLSRARAGEYDVLRLPGCGAMDDVGRPELPVLAITIALPPGTVPTGLEVVSSEWVELAGPFLPRPAQPQSILPVPGVELPAWHPVGPDPSVYGGTGLYPRAIAELASSGHLASRGAAGVLVHPVQFLPDSGALVLHTRLVVRVTHEPDARPSDLRASAPVVDVASAVFANPLEGVSPPSGSGGGTRLPAADYEYVIVTTTALESAYTPLVEWKTRKGVPARTVTVDWINATYSGADTQARIRSFVTDACAEWGTAWVLLGGDTALVPARRAYAMTCEAGGHPDEDAIACDLYYADLDGTWNADGDAIYGETTDDVDLYPDVFVGRASVANAADAQAFVAKLLEYERTPEPGWLLDMLLAAEILWSDPYTDSGIALDLIDRESIPARYDPITKLYESLGNESVASVVNSVNAGKSHFLHSGHAWYDVMGCGTGYLYLTEVDALANAHEQPILYSIGCWPAAFDLAQDCIAERFIRNPHGGAVAFIGNSRYGWASPGNPGYGYSERFMQSFYEKLFVDGIRNAGAALAAAKAAFVPLAQEPNVYRWHEYELNLLGDPEMPVWTNEPAVLTVLHPAGIVAGPSQVNVHVSLGGVPVEGALVCVTNGGDVYERGRTGADGSLGLAVGPAGPGTMSLTVTAPDARPYEAVVPVASSGPWLLVESSAIDDGGGNGDGLAGPGESPALLVVLRNVGTEATLNVTGALSSADAWVTVAGAASSFGDIQPGESSAGTAFSITVAGGCPNGHTALLTLTASAEGGGSWVETVPVTVAAPVLSARPPRVDDTAGDGDGTPEPGETVLLLIGIANEGLASAESPSVTLSSLDPFLTVTSGPATVCTVPPGLTADAVFEVEIDGACPALCFPALRAETETTDGFLSSDTLVFVVGVAGTGSDFESGAAGWTSSGTGDMWHLSDYRAHSGSTSWYCGSAATHLYVNGMDCHLDSPEFVVAPDMEVSFWCWHSVPIYGEDGLFVQLVSDGAAVDTLDFIGSGGALGTLGTIGNGWLEYRYGIRGALGDTVRLRFAFSSNASVTAEGFHIDDVLVESGATAPETGVPEDAGAPRLAFLGQNLPNPFSESTSVRFSLARPAEAFVAVYSPGGRLVRTLRNAPTDAGEHALVWDGKDWLGIPVSAGVYLCRLEAGGQSLVRKMVVVR